LLLNKTLCIKQAEEDANRVIQGKQDTIRFTTKAIEQISQQIVSLAIEQVRVKLQTKASARFHISVNSFKSALLQSSVQKSLKTQFTLIF
jgi:hypothetical protein